jgi:Uma2 family endonuclease
MERKFELYRQAGVREYWVLDPEQKILRAYLFKNKRIFLRSYSAGDTAPAYIFEGLEITLEQVFAE